MGFTFKPSWPASGNAIDADLDQIRDHWHYVLSICASGSIVIPGWQTTVQGTDKSQPDSITLTRGTKKIIIYYTWSGSSVSAIQFCYDNGVGETSPSITCYPSIGFYYDSEGNPTGTTPEFDPTQVSGCVLWLDASNRGSTENQWDDLSGQANHFTSAATSPSEFPVFAGGIATFDTSLQTHLDGPDFSSLTEGEIFYRIAVDSEVGLDGWHVWGTSGQGDYYPSSGTIYCSFGSTTRYNCGDPTYDLTVYRTVDVWSATNDWALYVDDESVHTSASNTVGFTSAPIIGKATAGYWFTGGIKSVVLYNRKLTAGERAQVKAYMDGL